MRKKHQSAVPVNDNRRFSIDPNSDDFAQKLAATPDIGTPYVDRPHTTQFARGNSAEMPDWDVPRNRVSKRYLDKVRRVLRRRKCELQHQGVKAKRYIDVQSEAPYRIAKYLFAMACRNGGRVYPAIPTIADACNCSLRQVSNALGILQDCDLVQVIRRRTVGERDGAVIQVQTSNAYVLLEPCDEADSGLAGAFNWLLRKWRCFSARGFELIDLVCQGLTSACNRFSQSADLDLKMRQIGITEVRRHWRGAVPRRFS